MNCVCYKKRLVWGELDLPLFGVSRDWGGKSASNPPSWSLAQDPDRLWFVAAHGQPARLHPQARPGRFQAGLWEYDVAELFLAHPPSGRYFEFNLAPNGAWWNAEFRGPRQRAEAGEVPMPEVATFAELAPGGGWVAAIAIPLDLLRARLDFGSGTTGNVSFILGQPDPVFFSVTELGPGEPDFHRPAAFAPLQTLDADLFPSGPPS